MYWTILIKTYAAMFFTGLIILYMVTGSAYAFFTGELFDYSVPFMFIIQSLVLAVVTSLLWAVFFGEGVIKKMRYFMRLILFALTLIPVFAVCLWLFYAAFTEWTFLWLIIAGMLAVGLIIISLLFERYFKLIGKQYTDVLNHYKQKI